MRPLKIKDRCTKKKLKKCEEVARTYDKIQTAYADVLDKDKNIEVIKCNVLLENLEDGEFTTDFLCTKTNGDLMVRECVFRKKLSLPRTCKLLDASRKYWARRGITDWAIVVEEGVSSRCINCNWKKPILFSSVRLFFKINFNSIRFLHWLSESAWN